MDQSVIQSVRILLLLDVYCYLLLDVESLSTSGDAKSVIFRMCKEAQHRIELPLKRQPLLFLESWILLLPIADVESLSTGQMKSYATGVIKS